MFFEFFGVKNSERVDPGDIGVRRKSGRIFTTIKGARITKEAHQRKRGEQHFLLAMAQMLARNLSPVVSVLSVPYVL